MYPLRGSFLFHGLKMKSNIKKPENCLGERFLDVHKFPTRLGSRAGVYDLWTKDIHGDEKTARAAAEIQINNI